MPKVSNACSVVEYSRNRLPSVDYMEVARRKPLIHLFTEVDVTFAREQVRRFRERTGQPLSFTAFLVGCLARAVDENKNVHAYRRGRKLVVFEDVDACVLVEHQLADGRLPAPHVIRGVNRMNVVEIHSEIRRFQEEGVHEVDPWRLSRFYPYFPGFLRRLFWRALLSNPWWMKRVPGTVCITAAGMFGKGAGWGIPISAYTLTLTVGGIGQRPVIEAGELVAHQFLSLTLSFDHEIVDGAPAARFANRLRELIETAYGLR